MAYNTYQGLSNVQLEKPHTNVLSNADYFSKAVAQYDPSFNTKIQGLHSTLTNNLSGLENSKGTISSNYDKAVIGQNLNNQVAKNNINNDSLSRGLSRSSIVTSGLASADLANNRALAGIQGEKTNALNNVSMQQANASADTGNQVNTLAANRLNDLQALQDSMKDKDINRYDNELAANRNYFMQQLGYNNNVAQMNDANYWKGQDQSNWQQTFNNNNYWKGREFENNNYWKTQDQNNLDRQYTQNKVSQDREFDLSKDRYNLDKTNSGNSQGAVNKRISDAATDVYSRIYGSANNNADALVYLQQNKARVLAQMTQAGMSASDALAYYNGMYKDLSPTQTTSITPTR